MTDIGNKMVIATLVLAIVVSLGGTVIVLTKLSSLQRIPQTTGFAGSDTGVAQIKINQQLSITSYNKTINFGTCTKPPGLNLTQISSQMTPVQVNATPIDCNGSNLPEAIRIVNIGNVNTRRVW